jgi:cyclic pyranopterin phosphate synthase
MSTRVDPTRRCARLRPVNAEAPHAPAEGIIDGHGRRFRYLRVAVTERCNLRCVYCMPEQGVPLQPDGSYLDNDEILRVVRALAPEGVTKVRFTGGEPLVRRGLAELIAETSAVQGIDGVYLTTNGLALAARVDDLVEAGLRGVNVSLDTLDAARFERITRRPGLAKVLRGVEAAVAAGLGSVKINVVAMRGVNDDELGAFVALADRLPITVRFIELMPFDAKQVWKTGRFFGAELILEALRERCDELVADEGSSTEEHVLRRPGAPGKLAVIPAYTRSLCRGCDRIRLTADGQLRNCLFSQRDFDLRALLREGARGADIADFVKHAMQLKLVDGWAAQREAEGRAADEGGATEGEGRIRTSMTEIGG